MEEPVSGSEDEDEGNVEDDNGTPVIEEETTPEEEAVETPEETPEVTPEEDSEEAPEETTVESGKIDAVADTESTITVEYKTEDKDAEGKDIAGKESDAEVVFLGGCVSSDKKLAEGRDLRFKVEPAAGRVVTKVEVKKLEGETETAATSTESGGIYTVGKGEFNTGSGESAKVYNGKIIITTKAVNYKVSFADDTGCVAESYTIYPVEAKSTEDSTKVLGTAVSDPADLVYGKSGEFAIEVKANTNKLVSITLNGEEIKATAAELNKKLDEADAKKTKCYTFTVDPSKAEDLKDATESDKAATVKVKVVAKAKLTVAFDDNNENSTVAGVASPTDAQINYAAGKFGTDSTFVEDSDDLAKSLAFKVTPDTNYTVTAVTAKATTEANTDGTAVNVTKGTAAADGSVECTIALSDLKGFSVDTTLTISIATDLDTTKNAVHTITFKDKDGKAPAHVTITHGATAAAATKKLDDSSVTVADTSYAIKVNPDNGYELAKGTKTEAPDKNDDKYVVTVKESRTYPAIAKDTENNKPALPAVTKTIEKEIPAYDADAADEAKVKAIELNFSGSDTAYADDAEDARAYTVKDVEVIVNATVMKNDAEKLVEFTDGLGAGYKITTEGVIHNEEADDEENSWVIPATVDVLTFTVTSAKEPAVTVGGADVEGTVADGVYTYSYPAAALAAGATPTEIVISDNSVTVIKSVKVKVVPDDVTVYYNDPEKENAVEFDEDDDGYYTIDTAAIVGREIELTFIPKPGVTIDKVSYEMGEEKGNGTVNRDKSVSLTLIVTDDVTVDVESKSDYRVKLTCGTDEEGNPKELAQDGDAYVADYTNTNIGIELTKAGETSAQNLYDVVVKDGTKTAATEATVSGSTATIAKIAESEYGKDLTIEVYINKSTKYTTTLKTNIVSEEVTVSRMVNGKDTKVAEDATVDIMPDAEMAFTVTPAKGASLSDLAVEILAKDGKALDAAANPIEASNFANGTLTVQTKPGAAKDTEVLVSVYNKNAEKKDGANVSLKGGKFVLKLTDPLVKTAEISKVNAVAGSATNRKVRLNVSVDFKNKKNLPAEPIQGDLYYKVEFTKPATVPEGVTVSEATTLYEKIDDFANTAKTIEHVLVTAATGDTVDPAVLVDIAEQISTTVKVTLVQSLKANPTADADYVAGPEAAMKDSTLTTKKPVYETKLSVKTVNGATVFTGQSNVKVATPVFGKDTSYDNITVQFVDTKTGVLLGSSYNNFTTSVAPDNSILVSSTTGNTKASNYKTLGVKVTAAGPDDSYKASAIVKLKVQQGIYEVDVDESKARLPETIFKEAKKAASIKITPLLNEGKKDYKPAKSAVTWEIAPYRGDSASAYAKAAVTGKNPLVSVKNGKVSISKDYQIQTANIDNMFTVTIKANDFADNGANATYTFEITDQKNTIGKMVVYADGKVTDPASLTAEDFYTKNLYVEAQDAKENELPVTFKSSNAKALAVDAATGKLTFYKPADKIKITATTVDGGKVSKSELSINVKPFKQVGLRIDGEDSTSGLGETDIHYSGGSNEKYTLYPYYAAGDGWNAITRTGYKNLKITVKGGKFIANPSWTKSQGSSDHMGYAVVVTDKSGKATVTITDTANKDKNSNHKDYTITNDNPTAVKAPSIKLYDPKKVEYGTRAITWQVTDKNNDNYAGSYVKLTCDYTFTGSNQASSLVDHYDYENHRTNYGTVLKIDENGRFTLDSIYVGRGTYKMVATVGTMVGGEFVASTKDVKLNFSIPTKKYSTNLTVKNSYTLDAKSESYAVINVKSDYDYEISGAMNVIKKVQGKDDHTNEFTKYFEVQPITYVSYGRVYVAGYTIGLKPGLSAEQIEYITSKEGKNDCTGYITVSNGWGSMGSLSGCYNTKDVQVKISFKANKYSLTNATIFSNGGANTSVTATVRLMNGKNLDYVALAWVDATDDGRFLAAGDDWATFRDNGDIILKSKAEPIEPGKYDVKLIVVPQSSSYVKWEGDAETGKWIWAKDKVGTDGKDLTPAEMVAKAGIPVTAKIEVKAVDTKSIAKANNLNVTLSTQLYTDSNGNGYVRATSTTGGYYQVDVPYTIAIGGSDISATAGDVKVNLTNKAGENQNEVTVAANTKEELVKAAKADQTIGYDSDGNAIQIPVIRLQVSKKALVTLNDMAKADKPITGYGKKLKVPVEIKYTNGITTTDTLNFNITMPKKAPADFEGVQKTIADNQAVIEKIQTKLVGDAEAELKQLIEDVDKKVNSLVPADTDVSVEYKDLSDGENEAASEPDYDAIMNAGKAKITLTLADLTKASANTKDVSFTYTLGMNAENDDLSNAVSKIEALELTYTNDTTRVSLLDEIKAADAVKPYLDARKAHLSLKVSSFEKYDATTKDSGSIDATIQVKDLVTGRSVNATVSGVINQLSNLTQAKTAVSELFDTDAEVLAYVDACSGQEATIKAAILAVANKAAGNKDIKIDFKADTATTKGWNYVKPVAAVAEVKEGDTVITPAVEAKNGSLSFTLVLTKAQADGSRSAEVTSATATIDSEKEKEYFELANVKTKIAAEVADATEYTKLKALVNNVNVEATIKTAIANKLDAEIAKYTGYSWDWAQKNKKDDFTYTPATQSNDGKLSFQIVLTLDGAKTAGLTTGVTDTITVTDVKVVGKADKYQTAAELKDKIEKLGAIKGATVPATAEAAATALKTEIDNSVNTKTPKHDVSVDNVEAAEGVTATTYTATPADAETKTKGEYKNVKITIGTGDDAIVFTHDFTFEVEASSGT